MGDVPQILVGNFAAAPPSDGRVYLCLGTRRAWRDGVVVGSGKRNVGRQRFRLMLGLACGVELSADAVFDLVWGDDPEGGPLDRNSAVSAALFHVRRAFRLIGLDVRKRHGFGWSLVAT